jgi:hypothetical protein
VTSKHPSSSPCLTEQRQNKMERKEPWKNPRRRDKESNDSHKKMMTTVSLSLYLDGCTRDALRQDIIRLTKEGNCDSAPASVLSLNPAKCHLCLRHQKLCSMIIGGKRGHLFDREEDSKRFCSLSSCLDIFVSLQPMSLLSLSIHVILRYTFYEVVSPFSCL